MLSWASMFSLFALLQAVATDPSAPLVSLGVGGSIAALVIYAWRQDRKESQERYERLAKESQDRYASLAKESNERAAVIAADFRIIVQDNTKAITALSEKFETNDDALTVRMLLAAMRAGKLINIETEPHGKVGGAGGGAD